MKLQRLRGGGVVLREVEPFLLGWLERLVDGAELQAPEAEARMLPMPEVDPEGELNEDWCAYVQPGLLEQFREARQMVAIDLHRMKSGKGELLIPRNHFDGWMNALNQSRLALVAAHNLGERELGQSPEDWPEERRELMIRLHFYAVLLEVLVEDSLD
jgi:hypothetical protein